MRLIGKQIRAFVRNVSGATVIEYGLIGGIICIGIVAGATTLGSSTNASFNRVNEQAWKS